MLSKLETHCKSRVGGRQTRRRVWISFMLCLGLVGPGRAQNGQAPANLPPVEGAPPVATATVATSNLEECISMAMSRQPTLAAARASLASANSTKEGLDSIRFGSFLAPDLSVRKKQSCLGISIAAAGLEHAEWETRYSVTRTYWTVQYASQQRQVVDSVIEKLTGALDKAKRFVDAGDPNIKVTQIDVDTLTLNLEFAKAKRAEADIGMQKANAALREAIGLRPSDMLAIPAEPLPPLAAAPDKDALIAYALSHRPEVTQAVLTKEVTDLEACAQNKVLFNPQVRTYASATDIHAKQIPQGIANGDYRPGAIGPEMPTTLVGKRPFRVQRAEDLAERAQAVVDKTHNLIVLDVEASYLKWLEAATKIRSLEATPKAAAKISANVRNRFDSGSVTGEELLRAQTLEDYAKSQYNEALFEQVLGLAGLERATAGGYRLSPR